MPDDKHERHRNRPWSYEEVVLACDLVADNGWQYLRRTDPRVRQLSELLRSMFPAEAAAHADFRNENGVARKTDNIATLHPSYGGPATRGGQFEKPVLERFLADPNEMRQVAQAIRQGAYAPPVSPADVPDIDVTETYDEGRSFERRHLARERDPRARAAKIASVRRAGRTVVCEVCRFDFEVVYGDRGRDFIECHHRAPLSLVGRTRTRLDDLAFLCSNCHRMIHRFRPWLSVEALRDLVQRDH